MNNALKLGGFLAVLAAVFALALGIGNAAGPVATVSDEHDAGHTSAGASDDSEDGDELSGGHGDHASGSGESTEGGAQPTGLMISEHGYTLALGDPHPQAGGHTPVTFEIIDPDGAPLTDYEPTHDKDLHFIAVRRDLTGFQHVHPTMAADGTWSTQLDLSPGSWRFFADFQPGDHGETMTLGADAAVAGPFRPTPLPEPSDTAAIDDYTVTLDGELVPGDASELTLTVSRGGKPVTDLQPYLAAYGHLVALRAGDLGYLHVHPDGDPGDGTTEPGPQITFYAEIPSTGDYRLFLDFKHDGVVRTAAFTATASTSPGSDTSDTGASGDGDETPEGASDREGSHDDGAHSD